MTKNDEDISMKAIDVVRSFLRKAAVECERQGITLEDVSVGVLYSTFDIAERFKGDPFGAVEWMRTGIDLMERQLMKSSGDVSA